MSRPVSKPENNEIVIIKKYANRRLYNMQTSCYITLDDLFDMVRRGEIFEVKDAKTEEDLTKPVLTQIIFEQESKGYNLLPIAFLRQIISLYGHNVSNLVPNYLEMTMQRFVENQEKFQHMTEQWQQYHPMQLFGDMAKKNLELFENAFGMFGGVDKDKKD